MGMLIASCIVIGSAYIANSDRFPFKMDGWLIGLLGGLAASACLHMI